MHDIERDGIPISARVDMLVSGDAPGGTAKSMALGLIGISGAIERLRPDAMLVLGDRFEILAAAQAAMVHNLPLVHIAEVAIRRKAHSMRQSAIRSRRWPTCTS